MAPKPEYKKITQARRQLILQALAFACRTGPVTITEVNTTLSEWIAQGTIEWPQADWKWARNEPYHIGTHQHLVAMARAGTVERERDLWRPHKGVDGGLRRRAEEVLRLKSEGKDAKAIAGELEISKTLAYSLINDPTGEKEKERKRGYCPACGAPKQRQATVCRNCLGRKAESLLPPGTFRAYCERAQGHGYELLFGVTTDLRRVIRVGVGRGFFEHEVRSDLTWLDGLHEIEDELGVPLG